ncbi:MAG: 3-deoxy-manno-octulosonate cytidylyltransferase [Elusimicrobiota bacterium]|jgi:3-deoxy-manno-octulosonate cytidylyltransferase (CMP-KDO synthetase)|nr:3-deoxy-manno-octulosonate cytidylyltransferase [Elusimicrobiota bacterium]
MKVIGFIPSRYGSTRFLAKSLAKIDGKTMIEMVYSNVKSSKKLDDLIVLTDDERIARVVANFNGKFEMTDKNCNSGIDRIISVLDKFDCDIVVNIQGDEPLANAEDIDKLLPLFKDETINVTTLVRKINEKNFIEDPNIVKVVLDGENNGIYFSRATIPFNRDNVEKITYYQHIGIYAYRKKVLKKFVEMKSRNLENIEKLEQLRFLENGYKIKTVETQNIYMSVDTKDDLESVQKFILKQK